MTPTFFMLSRIELNLGTEVKCRLGEGRRGKEERAPPRRTGKREDLGSGGLLDGCVQGGLQEASKGGKCP